MTGLDPDPLQSPEAVIVTVSPEFEVAVAVKVDP